MSRADHRLDESGSSTQVQKRRDKPWCLSAKGRLVVFAPCDWDDAPPSWLSQAGPSLALESCRYFVKLRLLGPQSA